MKQYSYQVNGVNYDVTIETIKGRVASLQVNGMPFEVEMLGSAIDEAALPEMAAAEAATAAPAAAPKAEAPAAPAAKGAAGAGAALKAPLPGVIIDVKVKVGDTIENGDTVVVLEAMKMNNNLTAECSGTVVAVNVQPGNSVMEDDVLVEIQ